MLKQFLDKCDIYYKGEKIPKENLLEIYSDFLSKQMGSETHTVTEILHTGSIYFNVFITVYAAISCIYFDDTSSTDIISSLKVGELVTFQDARWIFNGIGADGKAELYQSKFDHGINCSTKIFVSPKKFYLIRPYYGNSTRLDGRGIKSDSTKRSRFIMSVFDKQPEELSSETQKCVVFLTGRENADTLVKDISIRHKDNNEEILLTDLVTASYFSEEEEYRYPGNPGKNDPVLKFMSKSSAARNFILEDEEKKILGLIILGYDSYVSAKTEMSNLFNRKSLKNVVVSLDSERDSGEFASDQSDDTRLFVCSKQFLQSVFKDNNVRYGFTGEYNRKAFNIINKNICEKNFGPGFAWDNLDIKKAVHFIRKNSQDEESEQFVINSLTLINLFTNAIFPLEIMENAIKKGLIANVSPEKILCDMEDMSKRFSGLTGEKMTNVSTKLREIYNKIYFTNPKYQYLVTSLVYSFQTKRRAVIVPKSYYKNIFDDIIRSKFRKDIDIYIETSARFDVMREFDEIIIIGEFFMRNFNLFKNCSSQNYLLLHYPFETGLYLFGKYKHESNERLYNQRMTEFFDFRDTGPEPEEVILNRADEEGKIDGDLSEFIEQLSINSFIRQMGSGKSGQEDVVQSEICRVATCESGEKIFFTKFYLPYVIDYKSSKVEERSVDDLSPGDSLIFTKNNSDSQDIVDELLQDLCKLNNEKSEILNEEYVKSKHWKNILKKYISDKNLTFKDLAVELESCGIKKHEVTLRTWLNDAGHIVGPREEEVYHSIAKICSDENMINGYSSYYKACNVIRSTRMQILRSLAKGVIKNYAGTTNDVDDNNVYEYIKPKINEISQVVVIEGITDVQDLSVPAYAANRPHNF